LIIAKRSFAVAFYQKYRPKRFSDLIGENHIKDTLKEAILRNRLSHAYLLSGPRGTGKTSTARLLAKAFNCLEIDKSRKEKKEISEPCNRCRSCKEIEEGKAIDLIEIDAASHTKVDEIREVIDKAKFAPASSLKKIYIIDEVHMLSISSFNALLKTLEEPPEHSVFILATTEAQKLPATIISRTQRFDFQRIGLADIVKNLKKIVQSENIEIDDDALEIIALNAEGAHRDAISLLEQVSSISKKLTKEEVLRILGFSDYRNIVDYVGAIFDTNPEEGLKIAHRLYQSGDDMLLFSRQVTEILRKTLLFNVTSSLAFEDTAENMETIKILSKKADSQRIIELIDIFIRIEKDIQSASNSILPIEMATIESCLAGTKNNVPEPEKNDKSVKNLTVISQNNESEAKEVKIPNVEKDDGKKVINANQVSVEIWKKIIDNIKLRNSTLAALLRDTEPIEQQGNKIILGVKFPFHKDKISEPKNIQIIEEVTGELSGLKCSVHCQLIKKKRNSNGAGDDKELLEAAEEIFK